MTMQGILNRGGTFMTGPDLKQTTGYLVTATAAEIDAIRTLPMFTPVTIIKTEQLTNLQNILRRYTRAHALKTEEQELLRQETYQLLKAS